MKIERATVDRLSIPLSSPYHLSLGTVDVFDLIFISLKAEEKKTGYGEVATLNGYFDVNINTVWEESSTLAESVAGTTTAEAANMISTANQSLLARSAFAAAVRDLQKSEIGPLRAPVVGIISAREGVESAVDSVMEQINHGHNTIKLKIGFNPDKDAACLRAVTDIVPDSVAFRVDANQSYSLSEARQFLNTTDTTQLALFEQPLPVGDIHSHATLRKKTDVPIMLDEEIRDESTLCGIIDAGAADMVKFKQMKQGGPAAVRSLTVIAREHGLGVVLGNGVQSDVGCLQEAHLWKSLGFETTGEFNGWQKQEYSVIDPAPRLEKGMLVWDGGPIRPDLATIRDCSDRRYVASK